MSLYSKLGELPIGDEVNRVVRIGALASVQSAPARIESNNWRDIIQAHPFLRYERKSFGGRMVEKFLRDQQLLVQESIELDEIQGLFQMVANGLGVALIPMVQTHLPLPANVRALPLGVHTFYREVGLLQVKAKAGHAEFVELARCMREAAGGEYSFFDS